jgi:type IV pilus assembly protein PilF
MRRYAPLAAAAVLVLLAGCASKSSTTEPRVEPPQQTQNVPLPETTPRYKAELRTELAAGYYERGQFQVALEELGDAEKFDPTYPKIYAVYGLVYTMMAEDGKAEANFRKALAMAPNDSDVRHNWGAFLCSHGRARESIPEFELALRNPLYKTPEIALVNAGKCSAAFGDVAAAETYLRRALELKPQDADAAYNLALLQYKRQRLDEARALMRVVMQQPNPQPAALYLGMCIERKKGDSPSEQSYVTQLRNRFPDSDEAKAIAGGDCL